jgi:hypothetical protein
MPCVISASNGYKGLARAQQEGLHAETGLHLLSNFSVFSVRVKRAPEPVPGDKNRRTMDVPAGDWPLGDRPWPYPLRDSSWDGDLAVLLSRHISPLLSHSPADYEVVEASSYCRRNLAAISYAMMLLFCTELPPALGLYYLLLRLDTYTIIAAFRSS